MMTCFDTIKRLPDIERYGGETMPVELMLTAADGSLFTSADLSNYSATLSVSYAGGAGMGTSPGIAFTKDGNIVESTADDGSAYFSFDFSYEDTLNMYGKYTYQIEVRFGDDVAIGQGSMIIKPNVKRGD